MPFDPAERSFVTDARVGRLATVDADGHPHVVSICYAVIDDTIVTPIDVKPKAVDPHQLKRVRNITANPAVSLIVDRYVADWTALGWVRIDGTATVWDPAATDHGAAVAALREKYEQYAEHPLEERPIIAITPTQVSSWGSV